MLKRSFYSDLYKYSSLPIFKVTFFLVLGVSIFFTLQNIQVINALVKGNGQAVNLDPSILSSNPVYTVRDALLSSPYQASVIFLPILVSLVYSTHYQFGDDYFSQLLIPNWKVRLTGFIASSIVLSLLSTVIFSIVNAVILFVFLDTTLKNFLELTLFLDVTVRVMIFAIVLTLLASPDILILDEPINGLDPEGIRWVRNFLQSFVSEGKTVLMTSHYMSELELTVDHLVGISNGKIVIDAPTKDILKQFGSFEEAYFKALEGKEGE